MFINKPYQDTNQPLVGLVASPIGNLDDITLRALNFLKDCDLIACEDTRNTSNLLNHFKLTNKKLISLYSQNEQDKSIEILNGVKQNNLKLAYLSDAGMPGISDPGSILVTNCYKLNIPVTIFPGPTASLSSLVVSNIDTSDFSFYGFLPTKSEKLTNFLMKLNKREETLIFYESPKRLIDTLSIMKEVFSKDRRVSIIRELTKVHEEVINGTLDELTKSSIVEKGECVIIVQGYKKDSGLSFLDTDSLKLEIKHFLQQGKKINDIAKGLSKKYDVSKQIIYNLALSIKNE